jgi:hypothetical protein
MPTFCIIEAGNKSCSLFVLLWALLRNVGCVSSEKSPLNLRVSMAHASMVSFKFTLASVEKLFLQMNLLRI